MTQKTANIADEESGQFGLAAKCGITTAQAAEGVKAMAELATMKGEAANEEKYISVDDVLKILDKRGGYSLEIFREINEKAIFAVDFGLLQNWYIDSIPEYGSDSELNNPVWTLAHIEELLYDYALLPRESDNFSGNGYARRYEKRD